MRPPIVRSHRSRVDPRASRVARRAGLFSRHDLPEAISSTETRGFCPRHGGQFLRRSAGDPAGSPLLEALRLGGSIDHPFQQCRRLGRDALPCFDRLGESRRGRARPLACCRTIAGDRINAIAPSLTDTPLASQFLSSEAAREAAAKRHPLNRIGDPDQIAELVAFLISKSSSFMTGPGSRGRRWTLRCSQILKHWGNPKNLTTASSWAQASQGCSRRGFCMRQDSGCGCWRRVGEWAAGWPAADETGRALIMVPNFSPCEIRASRHG